MAGGALVMKLLQGEETDALAADLKHGFAKVPPSLLCCYLWAHSPCNSPPTICVATC